MMTTATYTSTKLEGYRHIFITKGVQTEIDVREVMMIVSAIRLREEEEKEKGLDYFQIFEFNLMDKKSPTSIGGAMNCLIFF